MPSASGSFEPYVHARFAAVLACALLGVGRLMAADATPAQQTNQARPPAAGCRVTGTVTAGTTPLPGVAIVVRVGDAVKAATSTDTDGKFAILFGPNATYRVSAEMMAFAPVEQELTLGGLPCDTTLSFQLSLRQRTEAGRGADDDRPRQRRQAASARPAWSRTRARCGAGSSGAAFRNAQRSSRREQPDACGRGARRPRRRPRPAAAGRVLGAERAGRRRGHQRQQRCHQHRSRRAERSVQCHRPRRFRSRHRPVRAGARTGRRWTRRGSRCAGAPGGPGGGRGFGPGGRGGGPGGFALGGRGGRGQSAYQGSANYTFGGSALDATNLQPRNGVVTPVSSLPFARNNFGATVGGPFKIPGLYDNTNRRTNFQLNYSGNHSTQLQDQYATVPTAAMRAGDFSASAIQLVDPATGLPFANNQIPANSVDSTAAALMSYIPLPNVPARCSRRTITTRRRRSRRRMPSTCASRRICRRLSRSAGGRAGVVARVAAAEAAAGSADRVARAGRMVAAAAGSR